MPFSNLLPEDSATAPPLSNANDTAGRKNMRLLVQLRWLAVVGQIITIAWVYWGLGIHLPAVDKMLAVVGALVAFNAVSLLRLHVQRKVSDTELRVTLLIDVGMLTAQLYLSGGATNPFVFLYLLQISLCAVLLKAKSTWMMVMVATVCFAGLAVFAQPLALPWPTHNTMQGFVNNPYLQGLLVCFVLNATLLVAFITRITRNLRTRDARLADLRQRAAEEEHIIRMGLLASGAAHELGTPLATLAVILGDWTHSPHFTSDPELHQEVLEMQGQIQRCKSILSDILLSAGNTRGEALTMTSIHQFFDALAAQWRATHRLSDFDFVYENHFEQDVKIVFDPTLQQMICNLLDNAFEASPHWVQLKITHDVYADAIDLSITDNGPGFTPDTILHFGKPYQSSKSRAGSGLGLFLAVNVARTLGGSLSAKNRTDAQSGAIVTITLPLASILLAPSDPAAQHQQLHHNHDHD